MQAIGFNFFKFFNFSKFFTFYRYANKAPVDTLPTGGKATRL